MGFCGCKFIANLHRNLNQIFVMKKYSFCAFILCFWVSLSGICAPPNEGMYPLSELGRIAQQIKDAGLKIPLEQVYNPKGVSMIDALVRLGGCTGSFVSNQGLIITNHHCAFGSVAAASTPTQDYLTNGFTANGLEYEIPAQGLTVRITLSYVDVSEKVLENAKKTQDPQKRIDAIRAQIKAIIDLEKAKNDKLTYEVSEMFTGKTYVLFRYQTIKDVRLVYAPPRSIGEYGGETDNWVWPRHTGDFSFVRAYVAADGSSAEYSKDNVPYMPKTFLKVAAQGVAENDFVMVLGYPGRTFRHQPAKYLQLQNDYQLPYIAQTYDWLIAQMTEQGKTDKATELAFSSEIKSLANVTKNYKGKIQGLRRVPLIQQKLGEEADLQRYIDNNPTMQPIYGEVLPQINAIYTNMIDIAPVGFWFRMFSGNSASVAFLKELIKAQAEYRNAPKAQQKAVLAKIITELTKVVNDNYEPYSGNIDQNFWKKMLDDAADFKDKNEIQFLRNQTATEMMRYAYIQKLFASMPFVFDKAALLKNINANTSKLLKANNALTAFITEYTNAENKLNAQNNQYSAQLNALMPQFLDAKMAMNEATSQAKIFVPDANATLRLTFGHIRGFTPADGVYNSPFTTLAGVLEKNDVNENNDFLMPLLLRTLHQQKDFGNFAHPVLNDVPVAFLYDLDTTGGNSGSPVINANGELVGVNFDRAYTATINDFAWNDAYSRSIGCDVRYVCWVLQKYSKANNILAELGV